MKDALRMFEMPVLMLVLLMSLFFYMPPVHASWQPSLRVGILQSVPAATVQIKGAAAVLKQEGSNKVLKRLAVGSAVTVTARGTDILVDGKTVGSGKLLVQAATTKDDEKLRLKVGTHTYRGTMAILLIKGKLTVINGIPTESYLAGVVPEEMPPEWPGEAVKAQAVAARTFALKNRKRHESEGFDVCATTHCQVYGGASTEKEAASHAISETAGEVIFFNGALIDALFHTDSGGMTENSEHVWGSFVPYLKSASEVQVGTQAWKKEIKASELSALLAKKTKSFGTLKKMELSPLHIGKGLGDRSTSGRVKRVRFIGSGSTLVVSGNDLRSMLGLRSTMFQMRMQNDTVLIEGFGWGHGLGLSQWGAKAWAEKGMKYDEILKHYYKGTTIKKLY